MPELKTEVSPDLPDRLISYKKLLLFFLPLGATPLIIGSVHSIINAALARLPEPELSLAVFTVVKSLTTVIAAPGFMVRQIFVSLVDDLPGYRLAMRFVWTLCAVSVALLALLGYTPLGAWVFRNIIGLREPEQVDFAYRAVRITAFLPFSEVLRNSYQGVVIALEKTGAIFKGIMLRLAFIGLFLWGAVVTQAFSGVVAGSITWVVGMGLEGVFALAFLHLAYGSPSEAVKLMPERDENPLILREILQFFTPLALMQLIYFLIQPTVQSGIARSPILPTQSLAAYGVGLGIIMIVAGPIHFLHQCSLVYTTGTDDPNWGRVQRFCITTGFIIGLLTLVLALSPLSLWVFRVVIGVSQPVAAAARESLIAFSLFPFFRGWREAYWGVLMRQRDTGVIALAKLACLLTAAAVLYLSLALRITFLVERPAVTGALAYSLGDIVESFLIWWRCRGL